MKNQNYTDFLDYSALYNEEYYDELCSLVEETLHIDPLCPCVYIRINQNGYYIGSSFNLLMRYNEEDLKEIKILQSFENGTTKEHLREREQYYIEQAKTNGIELLNRIKAKK